MQLSTEFGARQRQAKDKLDAVKLNSTRTAIKTARKLLKADVAAGTITSVARDLGLSWGTVANLVNEVTIEPRFSTMMLIYKHYGFTLYLKES